MSKNYVEKRLRIYDDGDIEIHCMVGHTDRMRVIVASTEIIKCLPIGKIMDYEAMIDIGRDKGWLDKQDIDIFARVLDSMK